MAELQKITIRSNPWLIPSAERATDGWLEGKPSEKVVRQLQAKALKERAAWKPSEEGLQLVEQLKAFIGTRVQIQFWDSIMFMLEDEGPCLLEGDCMDVLLLQQSEFLQAFIALENLREIPTPDGYSPMGYLTTVGETRGQLAALAKIYEVWPVNPDVRISSEQQQIQNFAEESYNARMLSLRKQAEGSFTDAELARFYPLWSEKRQQRVEMVAENLVAKK